MNQRNSTAKKYYFPLIGTALLAASLFQFSLPVFAAGTQAGEVLRNTATGSYEDNEGNEYEIDSNTVEVTVAKVAGMTNQPSGFTDIIDPANPNASVITGDEVSFEFTITNVGNDVSNIYIPDADNIVTKGLDTITVQVSEIDPGDSPTFSDLSANGIVTDVPINGQIIVKVNGIVTATAAGAPIEVQLGDTGSNTDINAPVADTQNQPDDGLNGDVAQADNEVRTETAANPTVGGAPIDGQKEASAVQQVFLGSNPLAMTKIEKTRVIDDALPANTDGVLNNNVITYNLELEVLNTTPNPLYTPGNLEGRNFADRIDGIADTSNLILVSDEIPASTVIQGAASGFGDWTPVYAVYPNPGEPARDPDLNLAADQLQWTTTFPTGNENTVTRVGWVYDARPTNEGGNGAIASGSSAVTGFTFNVITSGIDENTGGTIANIAQVFGSTEGNDDDIFDESGDQDPSNFNGVNPGPTETAPGSTGIADPSVHGVDSENNNNSFSTDDPSPGGEDNVITIGAPGTLINGPGGNPTATGNIFGIGPDNNHDFQNQGISNFAEANGGNRPQHDEGHTLDPDPVEFENTLSNPGTTALSEVLLQPINPAFDNLGGTDEHLPADTKVTIKLGTQQAIYTYTDDGNGALSFILDGNTAGAPSQPIRIPTLAADVPLDYTVTVDLPAGTGLSTDNSVDHGFPVPIIAFVDADDDGTPDVGENRNFTVNQVYTGFIRIEKEVTVFEADGTTARTGDPLPGDILVYTVNYRNISEPQAGTGNNVILNGINVMIDENGTTDNITTVTDGNNWALDNNGDDDIDTINVQNSASDSNGGEITYYTGTSDDSAINNYSVDSLIPAGTTDPGDTVTGYRTLIELLPPSADDSTFIFRRKVDEFDGLAQEDL